MTRIQEAFLVVGGLLVTIVPSLIGALLGLQGIALLLVVCVIALAVIGLRRLTRRWVI